jgi:hypothetical protein
VVNEDDLAALDDFLDLVGTLAPARPHRHLFDRVFGDADRFDLLGFGGGRRLDYFGCADDRRNTVVVRRRGDVRVRMLVGGACWGVRTSLARQPVIGRVVLGAGGDG